MCAVDGGILLCDSSACLADSSGLANLRASLRAYLEEARVGDESMHDSLLVLDTLATQALHYGRAPIRAEVRCSGAGSLVLIEVSDSAQDVSAATTGERSELNLVLNAVAARWGVVPTSAGNTVWAEITDDA